MASERWVVIERELGADLRHEGQADEKMGLALSAGKPTPHNAIDLLCWRAAT